MSKYLNKIKLFIAEKNAHSPIFFNHRFFFSNSSSDTQEKLTKIQLPKWTENISLSHNPSNEIETFVNYIENSLNFVNPSGKDTHKLAYALCSPSHVYFPII